MYVASFYSQCFICFFRSILQVCLFGCCICFTHMFQMFYLNVAYVLQWFWGVFASVSDVCCKCFSCFGRMLQVFHLNVAKIEQVLHMLQCVWKSGGDTIGTRVRSGGMGPRGRVKHRRGQGNAGAGVKCRRARETKCRRRCPDPGIHRDFWALALLYPPYHYKRSHRNWVPKELWLPLGQKRATH